VRVGTAIAVMRAVAPLPEPWARSAAEVAAALGVRPAEGLSAAEAARRRGVFGLNRLPEGRRASAWRVLARQLESLTALLLAAAAAAAFAFGEWVEGGAIVAVLALNTAIGFATELKAVRSLEALRRLGVARTRVRRGGRVEERVEEIDAEELVPGDVVLVEAGDLVTADLRLLAASRLESDESQLTGESFPVGKGPDAVPAATPLAERSPLLYRGTPVVRGAGEGVVTATGARTELGRIAALAGAAQSERTPLEARLERLGRTLAAVALGIAAVTAVLGVLAGRGVFLMLETGVALAVAAIPEGLPIVATLALARGVWRMAQRNALVNRLAAVETLGAITLLCTDKTGTLTENRMTLAQVAVEAGDFPLDRSDTAPEPALREALTVGVLCSNASLDRLAGASGDPLELALLAAGERGGLDRRELLAEWPEAREEAFDPATRMMATFHRGEGSFKVAVKGAPEAVLAACTRLRGPCGTPGTTALSEADRERWLERNRDLARQGFRVLALATKEAASLEEPPYEGLTWLGLAGSEITIGVDTALNIALEAIDRLKVTASSHHRGFLVEVMGRNCGYLALMVGIAGGAEAVLIPEAPTEPEALARELRAAYDRGKRHALVVVAEGCSMDALGLKRHFDEHRESLGFDLRVTILGHVQRGGVPSAFDRLLATRLGAAATEALARGEHGVLVGQQCGEIARTPLSEVATGKKELDLSLVELARVLAC